MKKIYTILGAALLAGGSLIAQQQNVPAGAESSPVTGNAPGNPGIQTHGSCFTRMTLLQQVQE